MDVHDSTRRPSARHPPELKLQAEAEPDETREDRYARLRRALPADQAQWTQVNSADLRAMLTYNAVQGVNGMDAAARVVALVGLIEAGELLAAGAEPRAAPRRAAPRRR